jgi:hypothetical protein
MTVVSLRPRDTLSEALHAAHEVFWRWFGDEYDLGALNAVLATAAAAHLKGDPLWLLLVSGSGNAKTETVQALAGVGAIVTSTISSEAAFLSGTPAKDTARGATGGLLRVLGPNGLLVIKDVTSIMSMNHHTRTPVLAALREIHDGRWQRNLGIDGGRTLTWDGRIIVVGAVTSAWDQHHNVISQLGDRFVIVRMDSTAGRFSAGRRAIGNTGDEVQMRIDLSHAMRLVIEHASPPPTITEAEQERMLAAADLVTYARTAVETDYRGNVIDAHMPEMPTRFTKQLIQLFRGAVAIGLNRYHALRLAIRCARDSTPPLRLAILEDLARHPDSLIRQIHTRLKKPYTTVDQQLQALHALQLITGNDEEGRHRGREVTLWRYRLVSGIHPQVLEP